MSIRRCSSPILFRSVLGRRGVLVGVRKKGIVPARALTARERTSRFSLPSFWV